MINYQYVYLRKLVSFRLIFTNEFEFVDKF